MMDTKNMWELLNQGECTLQQIVSCNAYTKKFGITITTEDALQLIEARKDVLMQNERIEFGESVLPKLIYTFCDSPYLYQDNYIDMISRLQEIFYLYKNESLDEVSDDELVELMKDYFDGDCQGSLDYLEETCLEAFARSVREGTTRFMGIRRTKEDEL